MISSEHETPLLLNAIIGVTVGAQDASALKWPSSAYDKHATHSQHVGKATTHGGADP